MVFSACKPRKLPVAFVLIVLLILTLVSACSGNGETVLTTYLNQNRDQVHKAFSVDDAKVRFVVEPGTPARAIGKNLVDAGLIGDDLLFEAYIRVNRLSTELEAGTFMLAPSMTMAEIAEALQNARADSVKITIPEGWRLEQIAEYLDEIELFADLEDGAQQYLNQAQNGDLTGLDPAKYPFLADRPAGSSFEGYLFPNTYEIPAIGAVPAEVFTRQLDAFAAQVIPAYEEAVAAGDTDLDLFSVLTVASIVEREAVVPEERPDIAGVYLNRIANGMSLEADPTVQYAMGYQEESGQWWKTPVFLEEYGSVDSPYNTYLYPGLPPGPIANPGLSSIKAVLQPGDHDYIYFVAVPDGTGAHVFAKTWEEHVVNVQRYQAGQ